MSKKDQATAAPAKPAEPTKSVETPQNWVRVPDYRIEHVWKSSGPTEFEGKIEESKNFPDFYQDNGTPIDNDGSDMEYSHTMVNLETGPITVIQKDYSQEDPTVQSPVVLGAIQGDVSAATLRDLWNQWMDPLMEAGTPPESDSEFIAWLVDEKNYQEAPLPNVATL
jgi:hypothetical protein